MNAAFRLSTLVLDGATHDACRDGENLVRQLLDEGAPVDEKDESGKTALMWASENGHTEVVRLLLSKGAAIDVKDEMPGHRADVGGRGGPHGGGAAASRQGRAGRREGPARLTR